MGQPIQGPIQRYFGLSCVHRVYFLRDSTEFHDMQMEFQRINNYNSFLTVLAANIYRHTHKTSTARTNYCMGTGMDTCGSTCTYKHTHKSTGKDDCGITCTDYCGITCMDVYTDTTGVSTESMGMH